MGLLDSKDLPEYMIIGNELKHWVCIGWVTHGLLKESHLQKYNRLIH